MKQLQIQPWIDVTGLVPNSGWRMPVLVSPILWQMARSEFGDKAPFMVGQMLLVIGSGYRDVAAQAAGARAVGGQHEVSHGNVYWKLRTQIVNDEGDYYCFVDIDLT